MNTKNNIKLIWLVIASVLIISCQSDYTKLVKSELAKEVLKDSLLFGLKFGDPKKDFFDHCMELNKQGLITQGPSNKYAQKMLTEKKTTNQTSNIIFLFYATHDATKTINGMDLKFYYSAWAPWNKDLKANALLPRIKDTLLNWFPGNNFLDLTLKNKKNMSVKVDGNRLIKVFIDPNEKDVNVLIENLNDK